MDNAEIHSRLKRIRSRYDEQEPEYTALTRAMRIVERSGQLSRIAGLYAGTVEMLADIFSLSVGASGIVALWHLCKICAFGRLEDVLVIVAAGITAFVCAGISKFLMNWA